MPTGHQPMWVAGATVVDGTGRDPVAGQAVLIEDGRIVRVGGAPPSGAGVIDCSGGMTLVPGLMDAHAHLGLCADFTRMLTDEQSPAELAADIFAKCRDSVDAGFTTVRDTGGVDGGVADVVASGRIPGPRILPSGPILCQTGGHGHIGGRWEPPAEYGKRDIPGLRSGSLCCDGVASMRRNVREAFRRGATQIKLCVTELCRHPIGHATGTRRP